MLDVPVEARQLVELHVDAELGRDRQAVMRVVLADPAAVKFNQRVFLGEPASAGYRTFRAGIAEYVALLPPNSHGEPNPADGVADVLRRAAEKVEAMGERAATRDESDPFVLFDVNGVRVGTAYFTEED